MLDYFNIKSPRVIAFYISLLLCSINSTVSAQNYPSQPIQFIVPQTAGGGSDLLARVVAQKLGEKWNQSIIIQNRPGAGGNLGTSFVANAKPDGYTWVLGFVGSQAINPSLYKNLTWDPVKDFTPLATLATIPYVIVVNKDVPVKNLQELIALAKKQPGEINFGSGGNGTLNHLYGAMLASQAKINIPHIPYRGVEPAMTDLIGGRIQIIFGTIPSSIGHIRSGAVRAIAVINPQRSPLLADVPTVGEAGISGFEQPPWFGILGPAGIPKNVVEKINRDINSLLSQKELIDKFAELGIRPFAQTPIQFVDILEKDIEKWHKVIEQSGATIN